MTWLGSIRGLEFSVFRRLDFRPGRLALYQVGSKKDEGRARGRNEVGRQRLTVGSVGLRGGTWFGKGSS